MNKNSFPKEQKKELDRRLKSLKEGRTALYTWDEVKSHIKNLVSPDDSGGAV